MASFRAMDASGNLIDVAGSSDVTAAGTTAATSLSTELAKIAKGGVLMIDENAAPADGALAAGQAMLWFDKTDEAGKLMIKAKTANGTVASGSVSLT